MKLTKTLALAALVAAGLLGGTSLQAQDSTNTPSATPPPGAHGMRGRPSLDQIAKELNLTDDQKTKMKAALEDQQKQIHALREDTSLSTEDKRAKAKTIREATQAKLKEILTPEQFEKLHKQMHQNRPPSAQPTQ
jgi:protein CpxP